MVSGVLGTSARYTKVTTAGTELRPAAPSGDAAYRAQASAGLSPGRTTTRPSLASSYARPPMCPDCRMAA